MVTEDRDLGLDDRYAFREGMIDAFRRRHLSDHVDSLSEDSPTSGASWSKPRLPVPGIVAWVRFVQ